MSRSIRFLGGLLLALVCSASAAQFHHICYEGRPVRTGGFPPARGIFGCALDVPGYCNITPVSGPSAFYPYTQANEVASPGSFRFYEFDGYGFATVKFEFFDTNHQKLKERRCTIEVKRYGWADRDYVLVGFTTDVSGLVTTAVWRWRPEQAQRVFWPVELKVHTPFDQFLPIGGGVVGAEWPSGALIRNSELSEFAFAGHWRAMTSDLGDAQSHIPSVYVIGLSIAGMNASEVAGLVQSHSATSAPPKANHPSVSVGLPDPANRVAVSGGGGNWGERQFLTVSEPRYGLVLRCTSGIGSCVWSNEITGWRVETKDHVYADPAQIQAALHSMPAILHVGGLPYRVVSRHVSATSAEAPHPWVDVHGLRGEYALTGIGATVNWRRFDQYGNQTAAGNLLWKLWPRPDLGGVSVASKDHIIPSPATITGHAIGIKLVPMPPD